MVKRNKKNNWDILLPAALKVLRTRRNAATGVTPAKALLGYELPKVGDWATPVYERERTTALEGRSVRRKKIFEHQNKYNTRKYDLESNPPSKYKIGDMVMVRDRRGRVFAPRWSGPIRIDAKLSDQVFEVIKEGKTVTMHIDDLRRAPTGQPLDEEERESSTDDPSTEELSSSESSGESDSDEEEAGEGGELRLEQPEDREVTEPSDGPPGHPVLQAREGTGTKPEKIIPTPPSRVKRIKEQVSGAANPP